MATKLFLRSDTGVFHLGTNTAKADTTTSGWDSRPLSTSAGAGVTAAATSTVTGTTNGIEEVVSSLPNEWISEPLAADVTISGTITFNLWMVENNMSANVGAQMIVEQVGPTGTITTIVNSEKGTELPTTIAAQNWTAAPTSTAMKRGDRIRVRVLGNDGGGTMASGFTFTLDFAGGTSGADGDSWVQFNEALTFETDPSGTQLFLTDTASDISTADVDREAWTSRGGGSVDDVTNTVAGWTAPIQVTDTAGGTAVTWFTKQLAAFTLGGKTKANVRAKESTLAANAVMKTEIAVCNSDGSNAIVWASACGGGASGLELTTSDADHICYVAGPNTSVSDGQRLRIRLFIDDSAAAAMGASLTVTTTYNGTSAGAAGDTYVTLQQTVTQFVPSDTGEWAGSYPQIHQFQSPTNVSY